MIKPLHIIFIGAFITLVAGVVPYNYSFFLGLFKFVINPLAIFGSLISAFGILWHNTASSRKTARILANTTDSIRKLEQITQANSEVLAKLDQSTEQILDYITGGESFCEVYFATPGDFRVAKLVIGNHGKNPVHDLKVRICDLDIMSEEQKNFKFDPITELYQAPLDYKPNHEIKITVGTVLPETMRDLFHLHTLGEASLRSFNIFFESKNGDTVQLLRLFRKDNEWLKAVQIKYLGLDDVLFEEIDDRFPKELLRFE